MGEATKLFDSVCVLFEPLTTFACKYKKCAILSKIFLHHSVLSRFAFGVPGYRGFLILGYEIPDTISDCVRWA